MSDGRRSPAPARVLLVVVLAVAVLLPVAATTLEVSPYRVTVGTAVVTGLLLIGAVALPALLLARWQATERSAGDDGG
ncbi:hypothetical protein [Halopiger xanaduensis]|uniref:Uncharacterized protein n=1 Tax=Halopiger xanaduensis (strain DSM 18323 / JCM 14033 / SH-6) TaxID=797210 RepID=F8D758_HALXS|nr:hypothetical protein [Halopiger xanaduensis]AEH36622.1 hypothetical protein Halxa_1997 [Halopiger xanaduensis SH-6]